MSLEDLGIEGYEPEADVPLCIDGDIVIYQPCCTYNEDTDAARRNIAKAINQKIDQLMEASGCSMYIFFVTTKFNFRDWIVDDYKANRSDKERPVNLAWAKQWAAKKLNCYYVKYMEADDLLGVFMTKNPNAVLWSIDKDLRQIPGKHLDDSTKKVINITHDGLLCINTVVSETTGKSKKKVYFTGMVGLHLQMLTGDNTDWIVGCGTREDAVWKSGAKKGQHYLRRDGLGEMAAAKLLISAVMHKGEMEASEATLGVVIHQYKLKFKDDWQLHLENQANLLFMTREREDNFIKRWTFDGRSEWMDIETGSIYDSPNGILISKAQAGQSSTAGT